MSALPQDIVNALYTKLTASQVAGTFYAAVSGRIYHGEAPPSAALPLLVYNVITDEVLHNYGTTTQIATVQFDLYGDKALGAAALADAEGKLYTLLDKVAITPTGFDRGIIKFTARYGASVEEDAWRITDEATITGTV
jgi:hypothetical protein